MDVNGQVVLVTGGASGLGRATVDAVLSRGARVVIVDLPGSAGADVAGTLGDAVRFAPADVTDPQEMDAAYDAAEELGTLRGEMADWGGALKSVHQERSTYQTSLATLEARAVR